VTPGSRRRVARVSHASVLRGRPLGARLPARQTMRSWRWPGPGGPCAKREAGRRERSGRGRRPPRTGAVGKGLDPIADGGVEGDLADRRRSSEVGVRAPSAVASGSAFGGSGRLGESVARRDRRCGFRPRGVDLGEPAPARHRATRVVRCRRWRAGLSGAASRGAA
jgi:hypothetical protein